VSSQGTHRDDELGIDDDTRATVDGEELLNNLEINAAEIERRKRHSRFDERDAARLSSIADDVDAVADDIVDEFYDHIDSDPEVRAVLDRSSLPMSALVAGQRRYLTGVVGGDYGRDYFADRARVGRLHDLLGLEPDAYLGQYAVYYERLFDVLAERAVDGTVRTETARAERPMTPPRRSNSSEMKRCRCSRRSSSTNSSRSTRTSTRTSRRRNARPVASGSSRGASPNRSASRRRRARETTAEVAEESDRIDELAGRQSDRMDDLSREANEMTATVEEVAATADEVAATSDDAAGLAAEGVDAASDATETMEEVREATEAVREEMADLQEQVDGSGASPT